VDKSYPEGNGRIAVGSIAQTICLVALAYGLGTCIEVQGIMFPDVVRKFTGLPESKQLVTSIAIGYPDWDFPANQVVSKRAPMSEILTWCGFD
jgi:nitroreductase